MAQRPDEMPAATGSGGLRASHADREQVIGALKAAFVQGRLAKDEFELRIGQALTSRTCAELATVTADLPAGLTTAQPARPVPASAGRSALRRPRQAMAAATVLYGGMWPLALALPKGSDGYPTSGVNLIGMGTLVYMLVLIVAFVWAQMLPASRHHRSWVPPAQLAGRPGR